ncbi:MAG: TonB-dependent receptor [Pirellulaceae bacterium]
MDGRETRRRLRGGIGRRCADQESRSCSFERSSTTPSSIVRISHIARVGAWSRGVLAAIVLSLSATGQTPVAAQTIEPGPLPARGSLAEASVAQWMAPGVAGPRIGWATPVVFQDPAPLAPVARPGAAMPGNAGGTSALPASVDAALLGSVTSLDQLPERRRFRAMTPSANAISGVESRSRETTDTGNLIGKTLSARGVTSQQRTPIVTDTRVRSERVGQVLASGSFWTPVRMDLDTMMNKIDSRLIDNLLIIKGPYATRYGPGFSFVDIDMLTSPRFAGGFDTGYSTSLDYQTNGAQWYGRQTALGGNDDWGYRISYGNRTGNDYQTGLGTDIPASYRSQDWNVALGWDVTDDSSLEFNYLRLDQTDVEFPGLVFDLNYLVTDGYELKYLHRAPGYADEFNAEVWYNRTRFEGDTLGEAKNRQLPQLATTLFSPSGFDGFAITDGDGSSFGYRAESIFGNSGVDHFALGTDLTILRQGLNDIEPLLPSNDNNFPLPHSQSVDVGFYAERIMPMSDWWDVNVGGRIDFINTSSTDIVPGVPIAISDIQGTDLDQSFFLWSSYVNNEIYLTEGWTGEIGFGFGQRPPTLTELYVESAFIGSLQRGFTFLNGDAELRPEQLKQIDVGLRMDYERTKAGVSWFYAWVNDYITYDLTEPADPEGGLINGAAFVNTDLAILSGIEAYGRHDVTDRLAAFGTMTYLEGSDKSRIGPARGWPAPRSGVDGSNEEPLPGIPPLDSRIGLLLHDPGPAERWGVEASVRMVARQRRVALSLDEIATPGFATVDMRAYRRFGNWLTTAGVENMTDRFYREHLDYRSGLGVFRPGVNFYFGAELTY